MSAPLEQIYNFVQLTPQIGTAGQPTAEQFADIGAAGYQAVINLAMHDSDNAVPEEGSLVAAAGMSYVHLPVDFAAPTAAHLRRFADILDSFGSAPVFVHCAMNLRVSAFMFQYLRHRRGVDETAARSPILDKWAPRMDEVWQRFIALEADEVWPER